MGASSELFIRMLEEEYFLIPADIRTKHLSSKITSEEKSDWAENMKDEQFSILYGALKISKKQVSEREFQLREQRIKSIK